MSKMVLIQYNQKYRKVGEQCTSLFDMIKKVVIPQPFPVLKTGKG